MEIKIYRNGKMMAQTDYFHVARAIVVHLYSDAGQLFPADAVTMTQHGEDYDISDWERS